MPAFGLRVCEVLPVLDMCQFTGRFSMTARLDFPAPDQWAERLGNLNRKGHEYKGPCPLCGGEDRFHVKQGDSAPIWGCRQCGPDAAMDILRETFPELKPNGSATTKNRASPRPSSKPKAKPSVSRRLEYHYYNADGSEFGAVERVEFSDGTKQYYPKPSGLSAPYPVYDVPSMIERSGDPVLIVEGEKAAVAAQVLLPGYVVTTSWGGSNRAKQTDWTPLEGRDVVIWPDADDAGDKYAWTVYRLAQDAGASDVRVIQLPDGLVSGFDLADPLPEGFDLAAIMDTRADLPSEFRGIPFLPIAEFMELSSEGRGWLVDELIPADGTTFVAAKPKVGKSTFIRCLAVAVADKSRHEFLGRKVATGPVLHLALDERQLTVQNHYQTIGQPEGLHVCRVRANEIAPTVEERTELLETSIRAIRPALVIIDTIGRFAPFKEASDYGEGNDKTEPLVGLADRYKTSIVYVHHARKSDGEYGDEMLGTTALAGSSETNIIIKRKANGRSYTATGRDGVETDSPIGLSLSADGWIDAAGTRAEVTHQTNRDKVLQAIHNAGPDWIKKADLIEAVQASKEGVVYSLRELVKLGDIQTKGKGVRDDPMLYRINQERA